MDERLFARLAEWLDSGPVVLASVIETRGATPRKGGSRMLVTGTQSEFSVGGGEAEARVIAAARALLQQQQPRAAVELDLSGKPGAAGVCGGAMQVALRRWHGGDDLARARAIAAQLRGGRELVLCGSDLGSERESQLARPDARLLIVGAGHCGLALYQLAQFLDFDLWVFDPRPDCFGAGQFARAECLNGGFELLARANATTRSVFAVLLNRDFHTDVAALEVLCRKPPAFMAMMGSGKRIAQVRAALPQHAVALHALEAPVGIEIAAQSPHEIAVSILAQLILRRRQLAAGVPAAMGTAQIG